MARGAQSTRALHSSIKFYEAPSIEPTTWFDLSDQTGWENPSLGSLSYDSVNAFNGHSTAKVEIPSAETTCTWKSDVFSSIDIENVNTLGFYVRVTDITAPVKILMFIFAAGAWKQMGTTLTITPGESDDEWIFLGGHLQDAVGYATTDFTAVTRIDLQIRRTNGSTAATVNYSDITYGWRNRAKAIFMFDDSQLSQYTYGFDYIYNTKGKKGNMAWIGGSTNITDTQAQEMYDAGWDFVNHCQPSNNLTDTGIFPTQADVNAAIANGRDYLKNKGWGRAADFLCFPGGAYDSRVQTAMEAEGCKLGITINGAGGADSRISMGNLGSSRLLDLIRSVQDSGETLADVMAAYDNACTAGSTIITMWHQIVVSGATGNETNLTQSGAESALQEVVDYVIDLENKGLIDIVTVSEWYDGLNNT